MIYPRLEEQNRATIPNGFRPLRGKGDSLSQFKIIRHTVHYYPQIGCDRY